MSSFGWRAAWRASRLTLPAAGRALANALLDYQSPHWLVSARVSFGADDFRRRRQPPAPFIVTEQREEPVELVCQSFRRLDPDERQRLLWQIARAPR
jgi:hypothetical protein